VAEDTPNPGATSGATGEPAPAAPRAAHVEPIVVDGDLDLLGAPAVREEIAARIDKGEVDLVVDLSTCTFVDSVGLSLLLTTRERCVASGGSFRVLGLTDNVRALLETVGVLEILTEQPPGT
jgi:anti-anti-sigma factor